jgi:ABC-type nitrate/sulfonate/bicarbonate transport system permease component
MKWRTWLPPVVLVVALLAAWQIFTQVAGIDKWLLPSPFDVVAAAQEDHANLLRHTSATVQLTGIGFSCGVLIGLAIAVMLHLVPLLRSAIYPLLVVSQNIPTIALAPLLVVWLGFDLTPKIIVIVLVIFFPVAVATLDGLRNSDPVIADYLRMSGASRWQVFTKLGFPHALPSIFSGVKIAATYSVFGAIVAEWLGSSVGIGRYMIIQKSAFRVDKMFVAIAIVVAMSLVLFGLVRLAEKLLVKGKNG